LNALAKDIGRHNVASYGVSGARYAYLFLQLVAFSGLQIVQSGKCPCDKLGVKSRANMLAPGFGQKQKLSALLSFASVADTVVGTQVDRFTGAVLRSKFADRLEAGTGVGVPPVLWTVKH
jgi:hypothetical protein